MAALTLDLCLMPSKETKNAFRKLITYSRLASVS
jgi:hypothetical protein